MSICENVRVRKSRLSFLFPFPFLATLHRFDGPLLLWSALYSFLQFFRSAVSFSII